MKNIDYFEFAKSISNVYAAGMQEGIEQEVQRQRVNELQVLDRDPLPEPSRLAKMAKNLDCHCFNLIGLKLIAWSEDYDGLFTCEELQQVIDQLGALLHVSK